MRVCVELSGESLPLALAELDGASRAIGGAIVPPATAGAGAKVVEVDVPDLAAARSLLARLALAHRAVYFHGKLPEGSAPAWWATEAAKGETAVIRWQGHERRAARDPALLGLARAWTSAGGRIDLSHPARRFWLRPLPNGGTDVGEEIGTVDRSALLARRMSRLPFQRPVGLDPRFARAAVNLARVRPDERVVDPFVGTGALLAEAALLGARVTGIDVDPQMIRGAARNFEHLGVSAESWVVADAAEPHTGPGSDQPYDALVTDVPYGRSSGTQGEPVGLLLQRVLPLWAARVRPEGRIVIVSAAEVDVLGDAWTRRVSVPVRQHRSLTRIFSLYERSPVR